MSDIAIKYADVDFYISLSTFMLFLRLFTVLKFDPKAYLPIATLLSARSDLKYFLYIYFLLIIGSSICCFVIYSPNLEEFQSIMMSTFSLLMLLTGHFDIFLKMRLMESSFATWFFIGFMAVF